jgi:hypothetical protein
VFVPILNLAERIYTTMLSSAIVNAIKHGAQMRNMPSECYAPDNMIRILKERTISAENINFILSRTKVMGREDEIVDAFIDNFDGRDMSYYTSSFTRSLSLLQIKQLADSGHGDLSCLLSICDTTKDIDAICGLLQNASYIWCPNRAHEIKLCLLFDVFNEESCIYDLTMNQHIDDYNMFDIISHCQAAHSITDYAISRPLLQILFGFPYVPGVKLTKDKLDQIMALAISENHTLYDARMSSISHSSSIKSRAFHRHQMESASSYCKLGICEDVPYGSPNGCALREIFRRMTLVGDDDETLPEYIIRKYPQYIDHLPNVMEHLKDKPITTELMIKCPPLYWRFHRREDYCASHGDLQLRRTIMSFYSIIRDNSGVIYSLYGPNSNIDRRITTIYNEIAINRRCNDNAFKSAIITSHADVSIDEKWVYIAAGSGATCTVDIYDLLAQLSQHVENADEKPWLYMCLAAVIDYRPEYLEYVWNIGPNGTKFITWYDENP